MRKIYSALLSLLFFFVWNSQSNAQVNSYGFVQSSGTYTPIAGTTAIPSGWDDNVANVTIPFSFTFNATAYTDVNISSNGFLTFGATAPSTTNYTPISNVAAYSGTVAAFGRDLISNATTIDQATIGTAPNRQFVVQWNNARRYNGGGVAGDVLNFQIILYETSNVIQVVYGTCTATNATAITCQVGLRGATNADFNNRTTTTDWSTTAAGVANADACTSSNTIMPVSGLTFTWLPPSPCVPGSLSGGTAQGPASTVCPGVNFSLSVTGASFGTGLSFLWQSSLDNSTWGNATGVNTNATYSGSITTNTYFRRRLTCGGTDAFSTSVLVSVTGAAPIPFVENFSSYATIFPPTCWTTNDATLLTGQAPSAFGIGLGSAKFDFYNAASGTQLDLTTPLFTAVPAGYFLIFDHAYATFSGEVDQLQILYSTDGGTSYTNLTTYLGGATGPLNTFGGTGGTFAAFSPTAAQWATKFIALPAGTNKLLFRGVSAFGNNLFLDNIVLTSCLPPTGLTLSAIAPTAVTLSWTASSSAPSGGYQWEVRTSGAGGSGAAGLVASGTSGAGVTTANVTGLTGNTTYTYYVRSSCGGPDFSIWAAYTFTTPCNPIAIPFIENFATYATTFPPTCWTRNNVTFLTGQAPSAYGVGLGSAKFDFYNATSGTFDLESPLFTPVTASYFLVFDHAYATFSGEVDQLQILYSTNGGSSYTNLIIYLGGTGGPLNTAGSTFNVFAPTAGQWATKVIPLPAGVNRLLFRGISAFGNNLFVDNIIISSCLPPSGLGLSAISPTTATLSWTASTSNPSNGYQWEVRTFGAAGSGATGLTASGTTAAGVTSANVTGLTPFTAYTYYVRSDCGGSDFSIWSAYTFTTPCNPIAVPFTENFATYATTFPPTCWLRNNTTFLIGQAASAYGIGLGSAEFDFYDASAGTQLDLVSPLFAPTPAGWGLTFDHAYATFAGEVDSLRIMYSTDGGASYSNLVSYAGGASGPLNTAGAVGPAFTPTAAQWANKGVVLPAGTNRLLFKGISAFGNNLFLDNIAIVSCLPPNNVKALGISPTEVQVSFTAPAGAYIVEYGPPGFTPGTGNTAGAGGTVVFTGSSPIVIGATPLPPLNPSTTYDFYVRRICTPGIDYSINIKATATTLCAAVSVPYLQDFESAATPALPTCTSSQDINGNSGLFNNGFGSGAGSWETYTDANPLTYVSPSKALLYFYDFNDLTRGADDWFYIRGLNLTAGTTYRLKFFYKALDGVNFPEKMEVKYGTRANATDMTTGTLFTNNNINSVYGNSTFDSVRVDFTPPSTGVYYIGFHAMSDPDEFGILMDDISVKVAPLVDVGISGITVPSLNCPTIGVFVQATITNYNTTTVNFATYPVTVTANITGASTGTLTALINSGILAPGESMGIYLSPAFNFSSGGIYNITAATATVTPGQDPETGNDAYTTSINVNPNPATPVITPPSASICSGTPVQLSTQFAPSPPPVTLPAVSSGTISIAVPDGSAAGASHSLTVNSVPAGATITAISVTLNMTHTWVGDMIFNLKAPNGNILNLDKYIGGTDVAGVNFTGTVISSATGLNALSTGVAPRTGTFKPDAINTPVAISAIQNPTGYVSNAATFADLYSVPNGTWTLAMADGVGFDVGTLTSWSITITYQILTPVITWTPVSGLYTNAAATTAYTAGSNAYSLYANPAATTTYTVTATTAAGCTASSAATVTVNPYPVITIGSIPDTVCISDPIIPLVASPVGGTWTGIGVSGTNFVPPATGIGTYILTYSYTNSFGCTKTTTKKIVVKDCPERIILLRDNAVLLFPNPNNGQFYIRINSVLYNNLTMKVYANTGVLVRTQQLSGLAWGRVVPIDLTNLSGGVYMVKFYYDGGPRTSEKTFKVIIGHE